MSLAILARDVEQNASLLAADVPETLGGESRFDGSAANDASRRTATLVPPVSCRRLKDGCNEVRSWRD